MFHKIFMITQTNFIIKINIIKIRYIIYHTRLQALKPLISINTHRAYTHI